MHKRITSLLVVALLMSTLCGSSTYARTSSGDEVKPAENTAAENATKKQINEKVRTDILKLVADAKAGRVAPAPRPQMQPQQSNNLSKRAKIAIGVGIAVAIVVIIVAVKVDKAPGGPIAIF